jgi:hypothetical protein
MLTVKGKSNKPCVRCHKTGDNRLCETKGEFLGALCKDHLWEATEHEVVKKVMTKATKKDEGAEPAKKGAA